MFPSPITGDLKDAGLPHIRFHDLRHTSLLRWLCKTA